MIETPAPSSLRTIWPRTCDLLSIGTNDLTQYTCALDRQNAKLEPFFDPHHPAVLKAIKMTIDAGHRHNIWVWAQTCLAEGLLRSRLRTILRTGRMLLAVIESSSTPLRGNGLVEALSPGKPTITCAVTDQVSKNTWSRGQRRNTRTPPHGLLAERAHGTPLNRHRS